MIYLGMEIKALRTKAEQTAHTRGHSILWHEKHSFVTRTIQFGQCIFCGMEVSVNTNPASNEIDIGGEAVAVNCKKRLAPTA